MAGEPNGRWGPGYSPASVVKRTKPIPEGRQLCRVEGCHRLARPRRGTKKHVVPKCSHHGYKNPPAYARPMLSKKEMAKGGRDAPCARCGWHAGACDAHRILPGHKGGKYVPENVTPLCRNCHYLVTWGKIPDHLAPLGNGEAPVVPLW